MEKSPICFFSNDLDELSKRLIENLYQEDDKPFAKKAVVVPSGSCKNYLMEKLANSHYQIAAGIKIITLSQATKLILEKTKYNDRNIPSPLELSFILESELREIFSTWSIYPNKEAFSSLAEYFNVDDKIGHEQRLPGFCDRLAQSFIEHGIWETAPKESWQKILWDRIFSKNWIAPRQFLQEEVPDISFHLFHMSYLPPLFFDFFIKKDSSFYELSPCEFFWEDVRSDKERLSYLKKLEKRGIKPSQQEEWNEYVTKEHRLLSNLGKIGRETFKGLQDKTTTYEFYQPHPEGPLGLLGSLQRSLLFLEENEEKQEVTLDDSIQVHIASNLFREVEICKQVICQTLEKNVGMQPEDIVIMATDIEKYFPYLEMIFGVQEPAIPFHVEDIVLPETSHLKEGLYALLSLAESGFSKDDVSILFSHPRFIKKLGLGKKETTVFCKWIDKLYLRKEAGYDWDVALNELLFGLIVSPSEEIIDYNNRKVVPIPVEEEYRNLLSQFFQTVQALRVDLLPLVEKKDLSLKNWIFFFINLLRKYFYLAEDDENLIQDLQSFCFTMKEEQDRLFSYASIRRVLQNLFNRKEKLFFSSERNTIRFCKFDAGKFTSSKVIYLLGMDEESFPRKETKDPFFIYEGYKPSRADHDRYLFLEALISAKKYLIMSYIKFSPEDQKPQKSSFVLQELFHYLDQAFWQEGQKPFSESCMYAHPSFGFDRAYFSDTGLPYSYSKISYEQLLTVQNTDLEKKPFLSRVLQDKGDVQSVINVKDLQQFARNPISYYFRKKIRLFLEPLRNKEEFQSSHLDRYMLKKDMHRKTTDELVEYAIASGKTPAGFPGKITEKQIESEHENFLLHLDEWKIPRDGVFTAILQKGLRLPKWESKELLYLPALEIVIDEKPYHIIGKIEGLTSKGLLLHGKGNPEDLAKIWPMYLIYLAHPGLAEKQKQMFFSDEKKVTCIVDVDAEEFLKKYIRYFLKAKDRISPCMPSWIELIGGEDIEKLSEKIDEGADRENDYPDEFLVFLKERGDLFIPKEICKEWKESVNEVFFPIMKGNHEKV